MSTRAALVAELERGGFVAAGEEADELLERAAGDADLLAALLERRLRGEPLAWLTGFTELCGLRLRIDPGVYVPRPHTELVAERAVERLPADGTAIDLCTGCGAVAAVLLDRRPGARVVASDVDPAAVACARANGVAAVVGDLFAPLPAGLRGAVDLVTGVLPYVPTAELALLHRDTLAWESERPYHGGADGLALVRRALGQARGWLRPGGAVVLELGGDQARALAPELARLGYADAAALRDEDGDVRGVEATYAPGRT